MGSAITPLTLNGISKYASDFQSILDRTVAIASIPIQRLQNAQAAIGTEAQDISTLGAAVSGITSALNAFGKLGQSQALFASSSDSSVVSAQVSGATSKASYAISNVTSVASAAAESSLASFSDATTIPVSTTGSIELRVGATTYPITLAGAANSLTGVREAINNLNAGVSAQILTTAGGAYLSVSANNAGATTLQLVDDPSGAATQLLTSQNQGTNTVFQLNGINVSTPDKTINNIVPGVTFTINNTTAANQTVNISLASDSSQISSALQSLVSSYNSVAQQVNAQTGGGGSLSGSAVIWELRSSMLQLASFTSPTGSVHSLADLGVTFDQTGRVSFDSSALSSMSSSQLTDAFTFLGSATSGLGGLAKSFSQISDPVSGVVASQLNGYRAQNTRLSAQISAATARVNTQQSLLQLQLEAADALVAQLSSQQNLLTSSIQSLQYSTYGQQILSGQGL